MKRFWIMLLVLAVALVTALPVGAAKPDCNPDSPDYTPEHPSCVPDEPDEPLVGLTCADAEAQYGPHVDVNWIDDWTFTFEIGYREDACVDVISIAGDWTIKVDMGSAILVGLGVRDSVAPGDMCWGPGLDTGLVTEADTYTFGTPASELNACGDDFGDDDEALSFFAWADFRGPAKNAVPATITVTLPEELQP
ncbi:MAG: hypothetical protein ABFS21_10120 [Actinomycetota bacterium]